MISLFSCNKEPVPEDVVQLRVENQTRQNFLQVITSGESFDSVSALSTTSYRPFMKIISVPSAEIRTATDTVFAGLLIIDYPSFIESGKYTLQIVEDSSTHSGYNCIYRTD